MTTEDEKKPREPSMPYWPAALRLDQASAYCGLSADTFKKVCTVAPIQFTQSSHGRRWLRTRLDEWLDSLDPNAARSEPVKRRLADRIGARQQESSDPLAAAYERFMRGEIKFDQLPPGQYGGMRIYADGEWEALVRKRPLGLNEKRGLSGFYAKLDEPSSVINGCGPKTIERLIARGYVASVDPDPDAYLPTCKITPEGEAAWLAIADREGIDL